jgi:hypothetical protein
VFNNEWCKTPKPLALKFQRTTMRKVPVISQKELDPILQSPEQKRQVPQQTNSVPFVMGLENHCMNNSILGFSSKSGIAWF